ncbi:hypothetical protein SEVIR_2G421901v4 [Setaria viridis]
MRPRCTRRPPPAATMRPSTVAASRSTPPRRRPASPRRTPSFVSVPVVSATRDYTDSPAACSPSASIDVVQLRCLVVEVLADADDHRVHGLLHRHNAVWRSGLLPYP